MAVTIEVSFDLNLNSVPVFDQLPSLSVFSSSTGAVRHIMLSHNTKLSASTLFQPEKCGYCLKSPVFQILQQNCLLEVCETSRFSHHSHCQSVLDTRIFQHHVSQQALVLRRSHVPGNLHRGSQQIDFSKGE